MNLYLVLAAPLVAAFLTFFLSGRDPLSTLRTALLLSLAVVAATVPVLSAGTVSTTIHTWIQLPLVGTSVRWGLASDGLSGWLLLLSAVLVPVALLSARPVVGDRVREFAAGIFLLQAFMNGALLSVDLVQFYAFFEAMLLPATILIGMFGGRERRRAAALFLIFSLVGTVPMFVGIWYISTVPAFSQHHVSTDFASLQILIAQIPDQARLWIFAATALAFLVKLPAVPFHIWQADAYGEGPAPVSALLTGVMAKIGLYGFLRIVIPLFPRESASCSRIFVWLGLATVLAGAFIALRQREARRVLAFSSLSHLGFGLAALFASASIVGGALVPRPEALSGIVLLMVAHGLSAASLFFLVGVAETWTRSRHVDDFGGLSRKAPLFAVLFAVAALASIGLPGTAGFVAEFLMLVAIWKGAGIVVAAIAGVSLVLSAAYTLRLVQKLLFGKPASTSDTPYELPAGMAWGVVPLLVALVYLGFQPASVLKAARPDLLTRLPSAQATIVEDAPHAPGR